MKYESHKKGFKTYLQLERALTGNTVEAYLHDADLLFSFLINNENEKSLQEVKLKDLRAFVVFINKLEFGPYS